VYERFEGCKVSVAAPTANPTISSCGYEAVEDEPLAGDDRVYVFDPFGCRVELMQPGT
jgi:hypothetical protein